ncbi:GNAT family N-acetyltransferase [Neotabrizicola sp. VNH66]|uniref:GNAT family N-acetyltransferase n=1 Tax=Neotabrizicola sp. VNH66 TaxID=3400918 RepID=UPI003C04E16E
MLIRELAPSEVALVAAFYEEAQDYWRLADRRPPDAQKAAEFFTDGPPGCDPAQSHRLGLFVDGRLSGVAELSFGFPAPEDGYLGLMLLAPRLRGSGHGAALLAEVERLARQRSAPRLLLAVLEENPRGRAFWEREDFRPTGISRRDDETGHVIHRLEKGL